MTAIPAKVAGVKEVIIITPPGPDGKIDAATLVAARMAGVTKVFKAGGAQGIAAVAYGTQTIPKVAKVVGPGSPGSPPRSALSRMSSTPARPPGRAK